jgi:hypothetical protein
MFSRQDHEIKPVLFPKEWGDGLKQILLNIYGEQAIKEDKTFEVYGFSWPTEVLLIVSYIGLDKFEAPVSLFISADLDEKSNTDKMVNEMFDSAGVFFDSYFAAQKNLEESGEIFDDYIHEWDETDFHNQKLFYRVTRENVGLTMQADLLLGE